MDYEQKYKEALERARELKNKLEKSCSLATPTGIESIFPELAESEDERIRKEVEKAAKDWYKENYEGENPQGKALMISAYIDGAIAWLKKQGEQKQDPCKNCKNVRLNCQNFPCIKKRADTDEWIEWLEKQVEREQLTAFAQHLNKRGAFRDDLCMDFEHEAQSFIEMQNPKESLRITKTGY